MQSENRKYDEQVVEVEEPVLIANMKKNIQKKNYRQTKNSTYVENLKENYNEDIIETDTALVTI